MIAFPTSKISYQITGLNNTTFHGILINSFWTFTYNDNLLISSRFLWSWVRIQLYRGAKCSTFKTFCYTNFSLYSSFYKVKSYTNLSLMMNEQKIAIQNFQTYLYPALISYTSTALATERWGVHLRVLWG